MKKLILIGIAWFFFAGNANPATARVTPVLKKCLWYSSKSYSRSTHKCSSLIDPKLRSKCRINALKIAGHKDWSCKKINARVQKKKRASCINRVTKVYKRAIRNLQRYRLPQTRSSIRKSAKNYYHSGRKRCLIAYR